VRVIAAAQESVPRTVVASGTLAAEDQVVLGVKVAGRLAELGVDLGSRVRKGQILARIDPGDYRLRVDQAQAALQQALASNLDAFLKTQREGEKQLQEMAKAGGKVAEGWLAPMEALWRGMAPRATDEGDRAAALKAEVEDLKAKLRELEEKLARG
jgi:multidrug efflux pump subunit AcrA (membrane-fusion protein)